MRVLNIKIVSKLLSCSLKFSIFSYVPFQNFVICLFGSEILVKISNKICIFDQYYKIIVIMTVSYSNDSKD